MVVNLDSEARTWGMLCHLSALAGYIFPVVGWFLGPLVVWLIKKDEIHFVDDQGKEALNFQITFFIILFIAIAVVTILTIITCGLGVLLLYPVAILLVAFHIIPLILGAIRANAGEYYRYPINFRLIK